MVHIATVLGKTGEYGSQREILVLYWETGRRNVDQNLLGKIRDVHWPEQLASFTSLIRSSILEHVWCIVYCQSAAGLIRWKAAIETRSIVGLTTRTHIYVHVSSGTQ